MHNKIFSFYPAVFLVPFLWVLAMWVSYYINWQYGCNWNEYGVYPRTFTGLRGVVFSPFLHGDIGHLANNSVAMAVLLGLLFFFYKDQAVKVLLWGWLLSGFGTWILGRDSYHIGASGLIYVCTSFIFFMGVRTRYYRLMAVSFLTVLLYGSSVWYMFPDMKDGISWEGHLAGFLTGGLLAYALGVQTYEPQYKYEWQHPNFDESKDDFIKQFDKEGNFSPLPLLRQDASGYVYNDTFHRKVGVFQERISVD